MRPWFALPSFWLNQPLRLAFGCCLLCLPGLSPAELEFDTSYALNLIHDSNISNATNSTEELADLRSQAELKGKLTGKLSPMTLYQLGGRVGAEHYDRFSELDNGQWTLFTHFSLAFSNDFSAPVVTLKLEHTEQDVQHDKRDNVENRYGVEMNTWLSTRLNSTIGVFQVDREARNEAFGFNENKAFANLDINLTNRSLVYLTYMYKQGDINSTGSPSLAIITAAGDDIAADEVFGGLAANRLSYRIDARTQVVTLGWNSFIHRHLSIDLSWRQVQSQATAYSQLEYQRQLISATLLGRF